jgi:hypothetical protein
MNFMSFRAQSNQMQDGGVHMECRTSKQAATIASKLKVMLPDNRFHVPQSMVACPQEVVIMIGATAGMPLLTQASLRDAIGMVLAQHGEFVDRYRTGMAKECRVRRLPSDAALECLNKCAWELHLVGASLVFAQGTELEAILVPEDPALLRALAPDERRLVKIDRALIIGCRETRNNQLDLFRPEDQVQVIVTLAGEIPEVQLTTTRQVAQQIYRGKNRLTATASSTDLRSTPQVSGEWLVGE